MLVIFLGTIIYPITYEHARRESLARNPIIVMDIPAPEPIPTVTPDMNVQPVLDVTPEVTPLPEVSPLPLEEKIILFNRDLRKGDRGEDVKRLQEYLNTHGFVIAETGAGSPGHETELFGFNTEIALKKFQEANAEVLLRPFGLSEGSGFFGEATRALINS